jgi:hypothetical protein
MKEDDMRYFSILMFALVGCTCGRDLVNDAQREVSRQAFDGRYMDKPIVFVTDRQGEFDFTNQTMRLHGAWVWAPSIYLKGIIAHEMIHADLFAKGLHDPKAPHNWQFWNERRLVANALDIPVWVIPSGKEETWIDVQGSIAYCEAMIEIAQHGFPVSVYSAVRGPVADIDPFAYTEE